MPEDPRSRALRYIEQLATVLGQVKVVQDTKEVKSLLENVSAYLRDSKYYLEVGDVDTSLVSVAYAEGLLDAARLLGHLSFEWPQRRTDGERRVVVAGTFDILHPGHLELLKFASTLGKVYVIVARDDNALRDKGRRPVLDEKSRLALISSIKYVYEAVLGDEVDYLKPIERIRPDYIVLGPDQPFDEERLADEVERRTGKRPVVLRFREKVEFSGGLRGSRDILARACASEVEEARSASPRP